MKNMMSEFSVRLSEITDRIDKDAIEAAMTSSYNMPAILCFYGASKMLGEDILHYETETVQLLLLRKRVAPVIIEKAVQVLVILQNYEKVLTVPAYFITAVEVLCDDHVETGIADFVEPAKLVWGTIALMSLLSSENIPVASNALRFFVACLKSDGWTMPPVMLNIQKFSDFFEYYDKEYYDSMECKESELLTVCGTNSSSTMADARSNFIEMHKPIFQFIHMKVGEIKKESKHYLRG